MTTLIKSQTNEMLVIELTVAFGSSMLESEGAIEQARNEAGSLVTGEALKRFDSDGSSIQVGSTKLTSKGWVESTDQTRYAESRVERCLCIKVRKAARRFAAWSGMQE